MGILLELVALYPWYQTLIIAVYYTMSGVWFKAIILDGIY